MAPPSWVSEWLTKRETQVQRKLEGWLDLKRSRSNLGRRRRNLTDGIPVRLPGRKCISTHRLRAFARRLVECGQIIAGGEGWADTLTLELGRTYLIDINQALAYCQSLVRRPAETIFVLISDLYEAGSRTEMIRRAAAIAGSGVKVTVLLAARMTRALLRSITPSRQNSLALMFHVLRVLQISSRR